MIREVITRPAELVLDDCKATDNGFAFVGDKGTFILARNTDGLFIWVRLTPGKVSKPVHAYDTVKEAIKDKMDAGYTVFAYDDAELN